MSRHLYVRFGICVLESLKAKCAQPFAELCAGRCTFVDVKLKRRMAMNGKLLLNYLSRSELGFSLLKDFFQEMWAYIAKIISGL